MFALKFQHRCTFILLLISTFCTFCDCNEHLAAIVGGVVENMNGAAGTVTGSPTISPTKAPTMIPSSKPSLKPSSLPTNAPTIAPSAYPTSSRQPSGSPTHVVSFSPSSSHSFDLAITFRMYGMTNKLDDRGLNTLQTTAKQYALHCVPEKTTEITTVQITTQKLDLDESSLVLAISIAGQSRLTNVERIIRECFQRGNNEVNDQLAEVIAPYDANSSKGLGSMSRGAFIGVIAGVIVVATLVAGAVILLFRRRGFRSSSLRRENGSKKEPSSSVDLGFFDEDDDSYVASPIEDSTIEENLKGVHNNSTRDELAEVRNDFCPTQPELVTGEGGTNLPRHRYVMQFGHDSFSSAETTLVNPLGVHVHQTINDEADRMPSEVVKNARMGRDGETISMAEDRVGGFNCFRPCIAQAITSEHEYPLARGLGESPLQSQSQDAQKQRSYNLDLEHTYSQAQEELRVRSQCETPEIDYSPSAYRSEFGMRSYNHLKCCSNTDSNGEHQNPQKLQLREQDETQEHRQGQQQHKSRSHSEYLEQRQVEEVPKSRSYNAEAVIDCCQYNEYQAETHQGDQGHIQHDHEHVQIKSTTLDKSSLFRGDQIEV